MDIDGLSVKKPVSAWNQPLKADFAGLFKALGRGLVSAGTGSWERAGRDAADALSAVGLEKEPGGAAWLLIHRALIQALHALVAEQTPDLDMEAGDEAFAEQLAAPLESMEIAIEPDFFEHPRKLELLGPVAEALRRWLESHGLDPKRAAAVEGRLPSYFVYALEGEWRRRPEDYSGLEQALETPFTRAGQRERAWRYYAASLIRQLDLPMFDEPFGLGRVYVPLRAYYKERVEGEEELDGMAHRQRGGADPKRRVVWLADTLEAWLRAARPEDAIRVVSGGPGSGKSSFAKWFAARRAEAGDIRTLLVPLHHLNVELELAAAVTEFVRYEDCLKGVERPLDPENLDTPLLLILDGLDELANQGKVGNEMARDFIDEVVRRVGDLNRGGCWLQVLITGRELVVQSNERAFRMPGEILHVVPYHVTDDDRGEYHDPDELLVQDQRDQWWCNYGEVSGNGFGEMPKELDAGRLSEITAQPLLNYLVSLSYLRGELEFGEEADLNAVYYDLLKAVHWRGWEQHRQHQALKDIGFNEFVRVLEEIAVAAWHGEGRTTSVAEIEIHCDHAGLRPLLERFQEGAKEGVTRLLTAFYFRQCGERRDSEHSFEFTHKSFGEYLTARRMVGLLADMEEELERQRSRPGRGWDETKALEEWARLCGPTAVDHYIFDFLLQELRLRPLERVAEWQRMLAGLIGYMLRHGMPMHRIQGLSYYEQKRRARNAEEALLAALSGASELTKKLSMVDWPTEYCFGTWINFLKGQREKLEGVLVCDLFNNLDLRGVDLIFQDLYGARFDYSDLRGSNLMSVTFICSSLMGVDFRGANIDYANFELACLDGADMRGVYLEGVSMSRVDLRHSKLDGAHLLGCDLSAAKLEGANIERTEFRKTDLAETILDK